MPEVVETGEARVTATERGGALEIAAGGCWQVTTRRPAPARLLGEPRPASVRLTVAGLREWDSSLLLFFFEVQEWCRAAGVPCDASALPEKMRGLLGQFVSAHGAGAPVDRSESLLRRIGLATQGMIAQLRGIAQFVGECTLGAAQLARNPRRFRWADCLSEMQQCGPMAVPIVSLVSFLVGVTLAYIGAIVLRLYGGDIYVADMIGLAMVREMGAVMTAVVLAGRTGAAFAATLGNMQANEEVDALAVLGIRPVQFLVLPRLLALFVMMPLLALYANALGILGGMVVAYGLLSIPPTAYWVEMLTIVNLTDLATGVIKSAAFGLIVGFAGCLRGLQAERSAAGVGRAATSAVVTALLLLVVADAIFAVIFNRLGW